MQLVLRITNHIAYLVYLYCINGRVIILYLIIILLFFEVTSIIYFNFTSITIRLRFFGVSLESNFEDYSCALIDSFLVSLLAGLFRVLI